MDFGERLQSWRRAFKWKRLFWLLLLLPWHIIHELLEDRFVGGLNRYIDKRSDTISSHFADVARFLLMRPVSTTAIFAILIVAALIVHAYVETTPSKTARELSKIPAETEKLDVQLTPSHGPSDKMLLAVTNKGRKQKFHATCRLLARRNDPNNLHQRPYDLAWERDLLREVTLVSGESCNLIIATADIDRSIHLCEVRMQGLSNGSLDKVEYSRWDEFDQKSKPEYDLEISLFGEGDQIPAMNLFTLKCGGRVSALEMVRTRPPDELKTLKTVSYRGSGEEQKVAFEHRPKLFLEYSPVVAAAYALTYSGLSLKNGGGTAYNVEFEPELRAGFTLVLDNPISSVEKDAPYPIRVRFCKKDSKGTTIPMDGMPSIQIQSLMEALSDHDEDSFSVRIKCKDFDHNTFESCSQIRYDVRSRRISVGLC
jgi:hypothetical protein